MHLTGNQFVYIMKYPNLNVQAIRDCYRGYSMGPLQTKFLAHEKHNIG